MPHANKGMIVYCESTPIKISLGCLRILHKLSNFIVNPIPNMATPSKNGV